MQAADAQSNYLQGKKKPSASVPAARIYLKQAIRHYLYKAEAEPCEKASFAKLEIVRDLTRRLRRIDGYAWWVPVLFATAIAALFLFSIIWRTSKTYFYTWPDHSLRIVQNLDPCDAPDGSCGRRFVVQAVEFGVPKPETVMHFRDPQHFEAGMTFSHISFKYIGSEAVTDGWDVVRDFEGMPVLAPNCKPDYSKAPTAGHIRCEGGKARF